MTKEEHKKARETMEEKIRLARQEFKEAGYHYLKNNQFFPKNTAVIIREGDRTLKAVTTGQYKLIDHAGAIYAEIAYGWDTEFVQQDKLEAI